MNLKILNSKGPTRPRFQIPLKFLSLNLIPKPKQIFEFPRSIVLLWKCFCRCCVLLVFLLGWWLVRCSICCGVWILGCRRTFFCSFLRVGELDGPAYAKRKAMLRRGTILWCCLGGILWIKWVVLRCGARLGTQQNRGGGGN